jgi:hypothetical protein
LSEQEKGLLLMFERIPILFGVIGNASLHCNPHLEKGQEVLIALSRWVSQAPAPPIHFLSGSGARTEAIWQALRDQFGLVMTYDRQILGHTYGGPYDSQWVYQHYPQQGLAIAPGCETTHHASCPLSGETWSGYCVERGCVCLTFQWGWRVSFVRWHESELRDGRLYLHAVKRAFHAAYYRIESGPERFPQELFPRNPQAYDGYHPSRIPEALRDLYGNRDATSALRRSPVR